MSTPAIINDQNTKNMADIAYVADKLAQSKYAEGKPVLRNIFYNENFSKLKVKMAKVA